VTATARASVYVYNEPADIDALVKGVARAKKMFSA
jgi:selenocysteine lyase/cysteine desulfurase